jgi:hypothetical protein
MHSETGEDASFQKRETHFYRAHAMKLHAVCFTSRRVNYCGENGTGRSYAIPLFSVVLPPASESRDALSL